MDTKYRSKVNYRQFKHLMSAFNDTEVSEGERLLGVIVISEDSFTEEYSEEARSYVVSNDNKAFKSGMLGYSIFGSSLDGSDIGVRLDAYLECERGGENGWKVEYCYFL